MKIGFTGTQEGMSQRQQDQLADELIMRSGKKHEFHHGDCIGADYQAATIANPWALTYAHPPINPKKRAYHKSDVILPAKDYHERNRDIVDTCDILIAAPRTDAEELRSGTWSTIRYAQKQGKRVIKLKR